jgi:hypothetical protein
MTASARQQPACATLPSCYSLRQEWPDATIGALVDDYLR